MLQHAIDVLNDQHIPTHSYLSAIQHIKSYIDKSETEYRDMIKTMVGFDLDSKLDFNHVKYTYLYLVQEIIRFHLEQKPTSLKNILEYAQMRATKYISNNTWVFAESEATPKLDARGVPKRKKGAKQEAAFNIYCNNLNKTKAEIVQLFMETLDMSKAGATTYYHNMKKKYETSN